MKIHHITNEEACKYGRYYCSTDKKWKCRQGPKQSRSVSESADFAQMQTQQIVSVAQQAFARVFPGVKLYGKSVVEGVGLTTQKGGEGTASAFAGGEAMRGEFYLTLNAYAESGTMIVVVEDATSGKYKGAATAIIKALFEGGERLYKTEQRELAVKDNANYDAWSTIASRVGAELTESSVVQVNEFAPSSNDDGDDGFSEETLKMLAAQWFNGDEDPHVERMLAAAGWEIGQDEGYDDEPGVFVVMSGDENGNSYLSWPADELREGVAEGLSFNDKRGKWEWDDGTRVSPDELTPAQKQRVQQWKAANPGKRPSRASVPDTREPARGFGGRVFDEGVSEAHPNSKIYDKCWDGYKKVPGKKRGEQGSCVKEDLEETYDGNDFFEAYGYLGFPEDELFEAEYQGRSVPLNKPMQGDVKKFKVYVKDPSTGNVKKVNFGDPDMRIKKSNPERRKSFRARHNCDNPGPKTKARYWSCRKW